MARMNAAVVTSFAEPPHYQPFEVPQPNAPDEFIVDVLAVGLHPRVRSGAAGAHYTSSGTLPMIPGIDAVGQRPDGRRIYFVAADDVTGSTDLTLRKQCPRGSESPPPVRRPSKRSARPGRGKRVAR